MKCKLIYFYKGWPARWLGPPCAGLISWVFALVEKIFLERLSTGQI
jgi:hypothetical protein